MTGTKLMMQFAVLATIASISPAFSGEWSHRSPFPVKPEEHYGRSRSFDLKHVRLDIDLDVRGKKLSGVSTLTFSPLRSNATELHLDAVELDIESVLVDDKKVAARMSSDGLDIPIDPARAVGNSFQVSVRYKATPRKGFFFVAPDQAWTQGESEDNRYWFPSYDYPNDRTTTETFVTVDNDLTVISNGGLIETLDKGKKKTFHYRQKVSHVTYLVSIVAGRFDKVEERVHELPLLSYSPLGSADRAKAVFSKTGKMLGIFEKVTGQPYPFEKYAQVVVQQFPMGGMENTTATTLVDTVLYPEKDREIGQRWADGLIAHELAHSWFGDLITCESWNHLWLNEGFATYFGTLTFEELYGADEFAYQLDRLSEEVLGSGRQRPTVDSRYVSPDDVFDEHIYERGAWILRMLRAQLGDELFLRGLRAYVRDFREKTVDTADLRRTFERETGVDLSSFFSQWVYRGGFLELNAKWEWDDQAKVVVVSVEQKPISGTDRTYYDVNIPVEIQMKDKTIEQTISLRDRNARVSFSAKEKPVTVRIDPQHLWLRSLDFDRSVEELSADLDPKQPLWVRMDAVRFLSKESAPKAVARLGKTLREDPFWGVRKEAARALGKLELEAAYDELLANTKQPSPLVRGSVLAGLRKDARQKTIDRLKQIAQSDSSDAVIAEAVAGVAYAKDEKTLPFLRKFLDRASYKDAIQVRLIDTMGDRGWDAVYSWARQKASDGSPWRVRAAAALAMGKIGKYRKDTREISEFLSEMTGDDFLKIRSAAANALGELGAEEGEGVLTRIQTSDLDAGVREAARGALRRIRAGNEGTPEFKQLRSQVKELEKNYEDLKKQMEFIEKMRKAEDSPK